jgi:crossover junction endodeoxyribonuclease RuvC
LQKHSKIILGIDPGTVVMGYGILEVINNQMKLLEIGVLKLSSKKDAYEKLRLIHERIHQLIGQFNPSEFAIEAPFFGKNVQSMLKLGRAQGVAIAVAMQSGIPVTEYTPRKIKQSITGNGNADKEQVWKMLKAILGVQEEIFQDDASDALAVAICHHFQNGNIKNSYSRREKGWEDFLKKNPSRVGVK